MEQKHTHRDRKQAYGYQRGEGVGRKVNKEYGINIHKIDKQQGFTVLHRKLCSISI